MLYTPAPVELIFFFLERKNLILSVFVVKMCINDVLRIFREKMKPSKEKANKEGTWAYDTITRRILEGK